MPDDPDDLPEEYFDPVEDEEDEAEADAWMSCGMMRDGQCLLAGSEWCDWDCPRNR